MSWQRSLDDHLFGPGPKRILSLDGGGVRGLITLGMLKKVETVLKDKYDIRICDYFDLIGGTSTGALIGTLLALGYSVDEITALYQRMARSVFARTTIFKYVQAKFDAAALRDTIHQVLREFLAGQHSNLKDVLELRMDTDYLQTGLALVTKRIDTGRVWILTNNKRSKYWRPKSATWANHFTKYGGGEFYPNAEYPLATIVQASASAPFYLDGVEIEISPKTFGYFLDGGASPFNNPCQELFLMTTLKAYGDDWGEERVPPTGFGWDTGESNLYVLSLGTGTYRFEIKPKEFRDKWAARKAIHALLGVIDDANLSAVTWMHALSEAPHAHLADGCQMNMSTLRVLKEPLLRFRRVNPELDLVWLTRQLGEQFKYSQGVLDRTREFDNPQKANLDRLLKIGLATGSKFISEADFPSEFDPVAKRTKA
jgi:hypothetical protein